MRSIANYVFEYLQIVGRAQHSGITEIDFALAGGRYFVMVTLNGYAALAERE
jgi:hypothetical protein